MIDNKILITIVGLLAAVFTVNAIQNKNDETRENFGMLPSFNVKVDRELCGPKNKQGKSTCTNVLNQYHTMVNPQNSFYTVPGTYQSEIAPRFFGGDYGANITYNLPSRDHLAVPKTPIQPLDFANAVSNVQENFSPNKVQENFCASGGCSTVTSCHKGGAPLSYHGGAPLMDADYADGNFNKVLGEVHSKPHNLKATHSALPVGDMTTINALGSSDQPIIYDRYMFANRNSRLRSQADKIRGDLAIVPNNNGWFNVSVQPNIDLEQGAMNVMGGINNESTQQLADLIYTTSGNYKTTIGGVNMVDQLSNPSTTHYSNRRNNTYRTGSDNQLNNTNMSTQYKTNLSAAGGDVQVVAYP